MDSPIIAVATDSRLNPMGHPLRYECGGAGSGSQCKKSSVLCTEIRNQRHGIRIGEGAPLMPLIARFSRFHL